jgi:RNA polymerase sigma-70 factor (ECF subfamily)
LPDEHQLLKSYSEGDMSCIDTLIALYEGDLFNLCCKLHRNHSDAEDLYQQTWVKVVRGAHTYRQKSFKNWLYTICLNTYRDSWRKSRLRWIVDGVGLDEEALELVLQTATEGVSAESEVMDNLTQQMLAEKVGLLPDKLRLPVILHYFQDLSYEESAQILGVPMGTIKSRLNAARSRLREELESELNV